MNISVNAWLNSSRDYWTGLEIYKSISKNSYLISLMERGPNSYTTEKLLKELTEAAGTVAKIAEENYQKEDQSGVPIPEYDDFIRKTPLKMLQVMRSSLPEDLKLKFDEKSDLTAYINHLRSKLHSAALPERQQLVPKIMEADLKRRLIHRELDHWQHYGEKLENIPVTKQEVEVDKLTPEAASKLLKQCRSRISKLKKNPMRSADLKWNLSLKEALEKKLSNAVQSV
jgi:thymidylate synthase ThyX